MTDDPRYEPQTLVRRLLGHYPIGPIDENGEPEFGWRDFSGVGAPFNPPIQKEAAVRICALEAENARLREALEDTVSIMALVEKPAFPDPDHHAEVKALGERIGFGALMSTASAAWAEVNAAWDHPAGGNFVAGPCIGTVQQSLKRARAALKGEADE